ncbi:CpeT/CpcT family (DUF1001) [Fragilaria crotonensis]|nr:CpeT/CpcT family (DUF1001) [Fragilaria crotonensis]
MVFISQQWLFVVLSLPVTLAWVGQVKAPYRRFLHLLASAQQENFLATFSGDFDNYLQVLNDRQNGLLPREGGGHEHIHCTLIPVSPESRLAAFYFDGNPQKIFRFRYYEIQDSGLMKLYTLTPELEGQLRKELDPTQWPRIYKEYDSPSLGKIQELPKCDVQWSTVPDPDQHVYALEAYPNRPGSHAVMVYGEAIVESTMMPGTKILVRDQLSLWDDEFWIHDRGFDPESMAYIYGNQLSIPYQLQRVTRINDGNRVVCNDDLKWTLGSDWRTQAIYDEKLQAINGVSSKLNA